MEEPMRLSFHSLSADFSTQEGIEATAKKMHSFVHDLDLLRSQGHGYHKEIMQQCYNIICDIYVSCRNQQFQLEQRHRADTEIWLNHAVTVLQNLSQEERWKRTGEIECHDASMFQALVATVQYTYAAEISLERKVLPAIVGLLKARKAPLMPSPEVCEYANHFIILLLAALDDSDKQEWTKERVYRELFSSGMLEQFLRCSTSPKYEQDIDSGIHYVFEQILSCSSILHKKFREGKPCGDMIRAIVLGEDGYQTPDRRETSIDMIQHVAKFCRIIHSCPAVDDSETDIESRYCRTCNAACSDTNTMKLMPCSRCRSVLYCSKKCQKEDWKRHKLICTEESSANWKSRSDYEKCVRHFVSEHSEDVLQRFEHKMHNTKLTMRDLLLEIDMRPGKNGEIPPGFRDPPEYRIGIAPHYYEGNRPNFPSDWSETLEERQCDIARVRDEHERMIPGQLLCVFNFPSGNSTLRMPVPWSELK